MLRSKNENLVFVSNLQYEKEFSIYQEIWEKQCALIKATSRLFPQGLTQVLTDPKKLEDYRSELNNDFVKFYTDYKYSIEKFSPFYHSNIFKKFELIGELCIKEGVIFYTEYFDKKYNDSFAMCRDTPMSREDKSFVYTEYYKELDIEVDSARSLIRDYLNNLKIIN